MNKLKYRIYYFNGSIGFKFMTSQEAINYICNKANSVSLCELA
jgi:hypothetical protein